MIRFLPDTWLDVVMRPFDMVAPEANSYVEIAAPDLRLAAAFILAAILFLLWRRRRDSARAALLLLALTVASMAPWMLTTGNGRYFIPWLILSGPLCVGLVRALPVTRPMKLTIVGLLILGQGYMVGQNSPWNAWALSRWQQAPYFQVDPPPEEPSTYVTIAPISYSLIAPKFPRESRWIHIGTENATPRDAAFIDRFVRRASLLTLVVPTIPAETGSDGQPSGPVREALDKLLRLRKLSMQADVPCRLLRSEGLARMHFRSGVDVPSSVSDKIGFWLCPVQYTPDRKSEATPLGRDRDSDSEPVFEAIERLCPRFFSAGEATTVQVVAGAMREYAGSDTKLYVLDNGLVLYKFWRSLNPVTIGTKQEVLQGQARLDCNQIRAPNWRRGGP